MCEGRDYSWSTFFYALELVQLPGDGMEDNSSPGCQSFSAKLLLTSEGLVTFPCKITPAINQIISTLPNTGSSGLHQLLLQLTHALQHLSLSLHQVIALLQLFLLLPAGAWDWISSLWVKISMCFFSSLSSRTSC